MNYGYIRVSTNEVDKNNQLEALKKVALKRKIKMKFLEDTISSGEPFEKRKISTLINDCQEGDAIFVAELSRFARNTEEMLMISRVCLEKGISLEILNPALVFDESIATKAIITVMGLTAELERHFIRTRTQTAINLRKEALAKDGFFLNVRGERVYHLGAKKGRYQQLKLEKLADKVLEYKLLKLNNTAIGKLLGVTRITVQRFVDRYPIRNGKYVKLPENYKKDNLK